MADCTCAHCGDPFQARQADIDRGWARFCTKLCKAKHQAQKKARTRANRKSIFPNTRELIELQREIDHERAMEESTTSHGQDGTGGW